MMTPRLVARANLVALLLLTLSACSSGGDSASSTSPTQSTAGFSLTVEPPSVSVPVGAELLLKVHVNRNTGFTDPVSITVMQMSTDLQSDMLVLPGTVDSGLLPVMIGPGVAVGTLPVELVAQSGGSSATTSTQLTVAPSEPSGQEKIEAAVAAGTLDYGTSLLYRAYALWGDRRLPETYKGAGSAEEDNRLFQEIRKSLASFPVGLQTELRPFIVRPADPQSVWNTPTGQSRSHLAQLAAVATLPSNCSPQSSAELSWISKRSTAYPVRVWAQCGGQSANDIESERLVDKTLGVLNKIYGPMTALMGEPILDQEGGDDAIDFYIVDPGTYVYRGDPSFRVPAKGITNSAIPVVGNGASAFVTVPRSQAYGSRFHTTLIHEFFHVLQIALNSGDYSDRPVANVSGLTEGHWFPEASATWAEAHFDRVLAPWEDGRAAYLSSHLRFVARFQPSQLALNTSTPDPHRYAAYIWPYFVEQETGGPAFMQLIWDRLRSVTTFEQADDAIDSVYSFAQNFKRFAVRNLNTEFVPGDPLPGNTRYVNLDPEQFKVDGKEPPYLLKGQLVADQEINQAIDLPNLNAKYVRLVTQDAQIKKVELDFSSLQPAGFVDVQALVRTDGGWVSKPLDLSGNKVTFCFDKGPTTVDVRGSFSEILLVVANHATRSDNKVTGSIKVRPKSMPCAPVWDGTFKLTFQAPPDIMDWTWTMSALVVFDPVPGPSFPGNQLFSVRSGTYTYSERIDETSGSGCVFTRSASGPMLPFPAAADPTVVGYTEGGFFFTTAFGPVSYHGQGLTIALVDRIEECPTRGVRHTQIAQSLAWWGMETQPRAVSPDAKIIVGSHEEPAGVFLGGTGTFRTGTIRTEWRLELKEE